MREIRSLRSMWRELETWHGRDIVTLTNETDGIGDASPVVTAQQLDSTKSNLWCQETFDIADMLETARK